MLISQLAHCIDFLRLCEWVCALWLSLYPVTLVAVWRSGFLHPAIWDGPFHPCVCKKDILHNNHFELQLNTCEWFCFNYASRWAVFCWSDSILRASCQLLHHLSDNIAPFIVFIHLCKLSTVCSITKVLSFSFIWSDWHSCGLGKFDSKHLSNVMIVFYPCYWGINKWWV
jgi:hypothetical protein